MSITFESFKELKHAKVYRTVLFNRLVIARKNLNSSDDPIAECCHDEECTLKPFTDRVLELSSDYTIEKVEHKEERVYVCLEPK